LYSAAGQQAQIITGVAQSTVAGATLDLSGIPGAVTAFAFDGQRLILGVSGNAGGGYLVSASSAPQRISPAATPSALAVANTNLYFADSQAQQIWQVQNYAATPAAMLFASDSGIDSPVGLQVSSDGLRLLVANAGNRKLAVYDTVSRTVLQSSDLAFTP